MLVYIGIIIFSFILYCTFRRKYKNYSLQKEHFMITGGSSGIGLAVAIEAAKRGANVTLIARSMDKLEPAKKTVSLYLKNPDQKVLIYNADVYQEQPILYQIVEKAELESGDITFLINCAGTSVSYRFEDTPLQDFTEMINVNYLGSVYMTRAVLPRMKQCCNGHIVFVSSLAGLFGMYGYTAYSASKFALVGLAQALQMEVKPYDISVTVSFPPDTDTPGYANEIKTKPLETQCICDSGGLYSAEDVAAKIIRDTINGKFTSSIGFEGWMLSNLCSGMSPINSFLELIIQAIVMGIFRVAGIVYLWSCDRTIFKCMKERKQK